MSDIGVLQLKTTDGVCPVPTEAFVRHDTSLAPLLAQCRSMATRMAARVTGNQDAAEDIAQGLLIYLWQHPDSYDPNRGSLTPWLSTVAHRRSVDWLRSESGRRGREERYQSSADPTLGAPQKPDEALEASLTAGQLGAALQAIPEKEAVCIRLAYFGGLTYREVAEVLGRPEGTVKSQIRAGLRRLGQHLGADTGYTSS